MAMIILQFLEKLMNCHNNFKDHMIFWTDCNNSHIIYEWSVTCKSMNYSWPVLIVSNDVNCCRHFKILSACRHFTLCVSLHFMRFFVEFIYFLSICWDLCLTIIISNAKFGITCNICAMAVKTLKGIWKRLTY